MDGSRSAVAGTTLLFAFVAVALSLLSLQAPAAPSTPAPPVRIDLSMLITGRGAIGGRAVDHLYDPQMLVVRRGDTVHLRVMNQSHFRHAIEVVGYGARTHELAGGQSDVLTFTAATPGIFAYRCYLPYDPATATCAPDHDHMIGHLVVIEPEKR